jgi:hypothetical protein
MQWLPSQHHTTAPALCIQAPTKPPQRLIVLLPLLLLQVAREYLIKARQQLLQAREEYDARIASHRFQRAAEAVLHQTLTAVAGKAAQVTVGVGHSSL